MTSRKSRGFSLLELMIVLAIGLTMASVTFIMLMPLFKKNHVDQAYDITLSVLRTYRNQAITNGTRYIVTATAPGTISVQRWDYAPPPAAAPAPGPATTFLLPQDIQFAVQAGFPNPGPDNLDAGATAVYTKFPCTVTEAGQPCLIFYPDGSVQDDASTPGNFNNGVFYLNRPGDLYSSRAIDVWGTTGRIRGWRLYNISGTNTWVQQ
jgi:prepilin-type N-terminal cleavage/methylation domain-containing protein